MIITVKLNTSGSFRAIEKSFSIINLFLNLNLKSPSHVTISQWVKKLGYAQLIQKIKKAKDWIIIIDESIQLGSEKLLVILAVKSSSIDFKRPLIYTDVEVLTLKSKHGWNAESIKDEIKVVEKRLGKIIYAVSDKGTSIKKALETYGLGQVHDITHRISNIIKKIYKADIEFNEYIKMLAALRLQGQQSKTAHIIPPQQRSKCRFMNIKPLSEWGLKAISLLEQEQKRKRKTKEAKEIISKLEWLNEKKVFIEEMHTIMEAIEKIFVLTKSKGLNKSNIIKCKQHMRSLKTQRGKMIKKELNIYFNEVMNIGITEPKILCTSDIIESVFGKYKMFAGSNTMSGITDMALSIPAFTSNNLDELKKILESVKNNDIKKWSDENIGDSLLKRRCKIFNFKNGEKKFNKKSA